MNKSIKISRKLLELGFEDTTLSLDLFLGDTTISYNYEDDILGLFISTPDNPHKKVEVLIYPHPTYNQVLALVHLVTKKSDGRSKFIEVCLN